MSAVPVEIQGMTRSAFILRGALGAAGIYGAGAVGPYVARALGQSSSPDLDAANFALTLENLEAGFYAAALKNANLHGDVKKLATEFGKQETTHVDTIKQLIQQLGGKPAAAPPAKFKLSNQAGFLKAAVTLEDLGVAAYNGLIPTFTTPDIVQAAASIVQVEARHAAALRFSANQDPSPKAFDPVLTPAQVQKAARKVSGG